MYVSRLNIIEEMLHGTWVLAIISPQNACEAHHHIIIINEMINNNYFSIAHFIYIGISTCYTDYLYFLSKTEQYIIS